ncbi:MAG: RluA family pseudouridine synthase [Spirochaetales bacterium]|nr:RluA family pseudouridine synthase [Spirochaetales bacterium]
MSREIEFRVRETAEESTRLDRYLADLFPEIHRSQLRRRLSDILCNGKSAKLSTRVKAGDVIHAVLQEPPPIRVDGEAIPLHVIAEGDDYLVINKPQGMVVHPGAGHRSGTLIHALVWRYGGNEYFRVDEPSGEEAMRPGIVHRLDKDTSGVMIVAKNTATHAHLVAQFADRRVQKEYLAIVKGRPTPGGGVIDRPVGRDPVSRTKFSVRESTSDRLATGARSATTVYRVLASYDDYSLVLLKPRTGRTHQLRVHMQYIGNPILGDPVYARSDRRFPAATLMLHALNLRLSPCVDCPPQRFHAPVDGRFKTILRTLSHYVSR